uniref:BIN2 n=1 Tax=Macrostomum lignano TaxID=282301 RepID=A0A1I8FQJ8_9PLAT
SQSSPARARACHLFSFLLRFPLDRRDFCERAGPQFFARKNASSRDTGAAFAFRTGKAAQQQADTLSDSYDRHLDDWMATVLSVIDKLRDRKARPDVERIFVMANRQRQRIPEAPSSPGMPWPASCSACRTAPGDAGGVQGLRVLPKRLQLAPPEGAGSDRNSPDTPSSGARADAKSLRTVPPSPSRFCTLGDAAAAAGA